MNAIETFRPSSACLAGLRRAATTLLLVAATLAATLLAGCATSARDDKHAERVDALLAAPLSADDAVRIALGARSDERHAREAWIRAVTAARLGAYAEELRGAAETVAELALRMEANGNFSRLQRARHDVEHADAVARQIRARQEAVAAREALVRELGLAPAQAARLSLPERLPELPAAARDEATIGQATSELRERYHAYRSAHELARHYHDAILPLRRSITDEMVLRYNGMLSGVFELLAEGQAQIAAQMQALEAERDFWLADAALQAALEGASPPAGGDGR